VDQLAERFKTLPWRELSNEDRRSKIILDLARIDIDDFLAKVAPGRAHRRSSTSGLRLHISVGSFGTLGQQKKVNFDIEIDGTTLNIFAEDEAVGMPVRESPFKWVPVACILRMKFTHASQGSTRDASSARRNLGFICILRSTRPLEVFDGLRQEIPSSIRHILLRCSDLAYPERVRIVETTDNHSSVKKGVVSSQRAPMAVIELSLGLTGGMSGLLGTRQTLIVEGGDDSLILHKLSGFCAAKANAPLRQDLSMAGEGRAQDADVRGLCRRPGVGFRSSAGQRSRRTCSQEKIDDLVLKDLASEQKSKFRVLMLGSAAGIKKNRCGNRGSFRGSVLYRLRERSVPYSIKESDLPSMAPT